MKTFWNVLAVITAVLFICSIAFATTGWMKTFKETYKPQADTELANAKCAVCHVQKNGKGGLNAYGKDLDGKKNEKASLVAIEKKDSDGDGTNNIAEIRAGTNPGDKNSKPEDKK